MNIAWFMIQMNITWLLATLAVYLLWIMIFYKHVPEIENIYDLDMINATQHIKKK